MITWAPPMIRSHDRSTLFAAAAPGVHCLSRHTVIMVLYIYTTPHSKAHHHGSYTSIKERTSYGPDLKHGRHAQSEDMKN